MEVKANRIADILSYLPPRVRTAILSNQSLAASLQEIVFRTGRPMILRSQNRNYFLTEDHRVTEDCLTKSLLVTGKEELQALFQAMCGYSLYSKQNEINQGFLILRGGCRVGVCGEAVVRDGQITNIKNISSVSVRIASERIGCSDDLLEALSPTRGVLICGAPCSGKTTLIRDIARSLSYSFKLSLIDERNELSATYQGTAQNDVGLSDSYVGYPKSAAISQAIRSMSPELIVCDELDGEKDLNALKSALHCGSAVIATVHCPSMERFKKRKDLMELLDTDAFETVVFLRDRKTPGTVSGIYRKEDFYV